LKGGGTIAQQDEDDRRIAEELRRGGASEVEIAAALDVQDGGVRDFEIWPENADAARAFLFCATQWRAAGTMGGIGWIGLVYGEVRAYFERKPPANVDDAWWALQVMEGEALRLRNRRADS
jgi:hypothetical protein